MYRAQVHKTPHLVLWGTLALCVAIALVVFPTLAHAGTGGTEFAPINAKIGDMIQGGGGAMIAGIALVLGIGALAMGGPFGKVAIGVAGVGLAANYGYDIITGVITALI